jgi:hypothetical protein
MLDSKLSQRTPLLGGLQKTAPWPSAFRDILIQRARTSHLGLEVFHLWVKGAIDVGMVDIAQLLIIVSARLGGKAITVNNQSAFKP